jgi:hypothetical protein
LSRPLKTDKATVRNKALYIHLSENEHTLLTALAKQLNKTRTQTIVTALTLLQSKQPIQKELHE